MSSVLQVPLAMLVEEIDWGTTLLGHGSQDDCCPRPVAGVQLSREIDSNLSAKRQGTREARDPGKEDTRGECLP